MDTTAMLSDSLNPGLAAVSRVVPKTIQILMLSESFSQTLLVQLFSSDCFPGTLSQSRRIARNRLPVSAPSVANNTISSTANLGHANLQAFKLSVRYAPVMYTITSELMLAKVSPGSGAVQERTSATSDARLNWSTIHASTVSPEVSTSTAIA
jgi:hypothetical protein